jgi:hypothetical protein
MTAEAVDHGGCLISGRSRVLAFSLGLPFDLTWLTVMGLVGYATRACGFAARHGANADMAGVTSQ